MPIEIDCPCTYRPYSPRTVSGIDYCGDCNLGKIIVYSQAEMDKAIQEEREGCAELCDKLYPKRKGFTHLSSHECAEAIRNRP